MSDRRIVRCKFCKKLYRAYSDYLGENEFACPNCTAEADANEPKQTFSANADYEISSNISR